MSEPDEPDEPTIALTEGEHATLFGTSWDDLTQEYLMALAVMDTRRIMTVPSLRYNRDESLLNTAAWLQVSGGSPVHTLEVASDVDLIMNGLGETYTHYHSAPNSQPLGRLRMDLSRGQGGVVDHGEIVALLSPDSYGEVSMAPTAFRRHCRNWLAMTNYQPTTEAPSPIRGMNAHKLEEEEDDDE